MDDIQVLKSMEEIWKPVEGYEESHMVSNFGRIKVLRREVNNNGGIKVIIERIQKPRIDSVGYVEFLASNKSLNKKVRSRVHRLVAKAFIPNPENKPCVNHIDNNKKNNCVSNLEWCTHDENMKHAAKQGRLNRGEKNRASKLSEEDVIFIRNSNLSLRELCKKFNLTYNYIFVVKRGDSWKYLKQ